MPPPRRRARSTRAASSDTPSHTPSAPRSTTPTSLVACVVGDGEAETGPLATGWHGNKFLNARTDGAVLPILHLNGYKIANPTVLARIPPDELSALLRGNGWDPLWVDIEIGDDHEAAHRRFAAVLDQALDGIAGYPAAPRATTAPRAGRPGR